MFYTYLWLREDGTPYYIGKGQGKRAYMHHKRHGNAPLLGRILFYIAKDEADAFENEIALIWYYGRKDLGTGCLRNLTDGGENPPSHKGKKLSEAHRKVLVASRKGVKASEATLKRLRDSHVGQQQSEETIHRQVESRKGYRHSEETIKKISEAQKGIKRAPLSPSVRSKISNALKGRVVSEEHRQALSAALKGKHTAWSDLRRTVFELKKYTRGSNG